MIKPEELILVNCGVDLHFVFEDPQVTELAQFGQLPGDPSGVSLVVLRGECRHSALSAVLAPLSPRVPLSRPVTGEVSQPGGSGAELKEGVSSQTSASTASTYLG